MNNLPQHTGFYWAKSGNYKWWNLIVRIYGEFPYLQIEAWDRGLNNNIRNYLPFEIAEWGPEIPYPEDDNNE